MQSLRKSQALKSLLLWNFSNSCFRFWNITWEGGCRLGVLRTALNERNICLVFTAIHRNTFRVVRLKSLLFKLRILLNLDALLNFVILLAMAQGIIGEEHFAFTHLATAVARSETSWLTSSIYSPWTFLRVVVERKFWRLLRLWVLTLISTFLLIEVLGGRATAFIELIL